MTSESPVDVLVAGAINTDLVAMVNRAPAAGETITGFGFAVFGGGKGANQAVAVARSGAVVALLGATGDDDFGQARRADVRADGIVTDWIETNPDVASGVALVTVEAHGENRIAYIPGATLTITAERAVSCLRSVRPRFLLVPNELKPEALLALCTAARESGVRVILNAAPDPELVIDVLPFVNILIVNRGEATALARLPAEDQPIERVAMALHSTGIKRVVITIGSEGVIGVDEDGIFTEPAPQVAVVDTTGAGDTFCGALAASLARDCPFRSAVEYAAVAGAISVTRAGAQSSIPMRLEIEAFLQR